MNRFWKDIFLVKDLSLQSSEKYFCRGHMLVFEIRTCLCMYLTGNFYNRNTKETETFSNTMIYSCIDLSFCCLIIRTWGISVSQNMLDC